MAAVPTTHPSFSPSSSPSFSPSFEPTVEPTTFGPTTFFPTTSPINVYRISDYAPLFITFAVLTVLLCLYVIVSYCRNEKYRKPPAAYMLSKTIADMLFAILFFIMLLTVKTGSNAVPDNTKTPQCKYLGAAFVCVWIVSCLYFTTMSWDLYRTLRNPFRPPAADSFKMHLIVLIMGIGSISIVWPLDIFRYRLKFGICYTCNTGDTISLYNTFFIYLPMGIAVFSGIASTVYAVRRLSNGLSKTFELRRYITCCFPLCSRCTIQIHSDFTESPFLSIFRSIIYSVSC